MPEQSDYATQFARLGYVVVRGLLTPSEADHYRSLICELSGVGDDKWEKDAFECPDGVSENEQFWPLITHPKLIETMRAVLGPDTRYTQHSDLHAHRTGSWHRDCACRTFGTGPDWDESTSPYKVARVAIYLQSFAESGSSLGVIPGSHRFEKELPRFGVKYWTLVQRLQRKILGKYDEVPYHTSPRSPRIQTSKTGLPVVGIAAPPIWIKTEPGDTIIFDQRLYHSASHIHGPKYAVYLSYAAENSHAINHMDYFVNYREDLGYGELDDRLRHILGSDSLLLDPPTPRPREDYESCGFSRVDY